ncbi:MAG: FAD-binding domain-containing protein [Tepidisphaerales bacterium]
MSLFHARFDQFVRERLPETLAAGDALPPLDGGRHAALARLNGVRLGRYASTRNHLDGDVTRLSAYLRHGCLSLAEVRDAALQRHKPYEVQKFISELGWRDYYQRVYAAVGNRLLDDLEPYKTGFSPDDYADDLPPDIPAGETGLACMDAFARELADTGYLHNHARMWVAAYVVHHRRVKWQAGANWFLTHLLDGDVASNHLSWQWVASTFSHKPYFFNRENLERYTDARYCQRCSVRRSCPFAGEYDDLARRLFAAPLPDPDGPPQPPTRTPPGHRKVSLKVVADDPPPGTDPHADRPLPHADAVVWAHDEALSAAHPAFSTGLPAIAVLDRPRIDAERWAFKRAVFVATSASELLETLARRSGEPTRDPCERLAVGDAATLVADFADAHKARMVVIPRSTTPRIRDVAAALSRKFAVVWADPPAFASLRGPVDLTRFSRYWRVAEPKAMRPTG